MIKVMLRGKMALETDQAAAGKAFDIQGLPTSAHLLCVAHITNNSLDMSSIWVMSI